MDYRDERDALRGRVERLEQELEDARQELEDARRREGEAAAEGSRVEAARVERLAAALPEAEVLVQRLRRELAAVEAMRSPHGAAVEENEATRPRAAERTRAPAEPKGRLMALPMVILLAAIGGFALVRWYGTRETYRHLEWCSKSSSCCVPSHDPSDSFCTWVANNCDAFRIYGCPKRPMTVAPTSAPAELTGEVAVGPLEIVRQDPYGRDGGGR